jgi:hypothetical protein
MMRAPTRSSRHTPWSALTRAMPTRPAPVAVWVIALEAILLVGLGVCAVGGTAAAPGRPVEPVTDVAGLALTRAHGLLLVLTGLAALAALRHPTWLLGYAGIQAVAYLVVTVVGLALPHTPWWSLNLADHVLHAALFLLGVALWLLLRGGAVAHRRAPLGADQGALP